MDDLSTENFILWLLPHKGEGFDDAAFATYKLENKLRFVAARRDVPKQRDIPREEREGTELPVDIANGKPPILNITDLVQFKAFLPDHDYASQEYIDRLERFRTGTADPENLFASLIIQSAQGTQLPSGEQTPLKCSNSRPIFYRKPLGRGAFGIVTFVWDLSTKEEYAVKQPPDEIIKARNYDDKVWRKEAEIMKSLTHKHVVAFRGATFSPYPRLKFEYVPGGSLDKHTNLSIFESTQVLYQLSSGLEYLHSRSPSIAHCDIKPENILVERREADGIYVKSADFGLSKAADVLKTCCGTLLYAAPEIYLKFADPVGAGKDTYGVSVDIWSLGVVIASLVCGLPVYMEELSTNAVNWILAIQARVNDPYVKYGGELLYLLRDAMLVEDPNKRSSVDYLTVEALKILESMENELDEEGSATPTTLIVGARKRSWPKGNSSSSSPRSFTSLPSADQQRAIKHGQPRRKRSRLEGRIAGDLSGESK